MRIRFYRRYLAASTGRVLHLTSKKFSLFLPVCSHQHLTLATRQYDVQFEKTFRERKANPFFLQVRLQMLVNGQISCLAVYRGSLKTQDRQVRKPLSAVNFYFVPPLNYEIADAEACTKVWRGGKVK